MKDITRNVVIGVFCLTIIILTSVFYCYNVYSNNVNNEESPVLISSGRKVISVLIDERYSDSYMLNDEPRIWTGYSIKPADEYGTIINSGSDYYSAFLTPYGDFYDNYIARNTTVWICALVETYEDAYYKAMPYPNVIFVEYNDALEYANKHNFT